MKAVGLLEACADSELLALDLWPRQREILKQIDSGKYREIILALGRRSGKSLMAAAVAVHDACFRDLTAYHRPGEVRCVVCVAASQPQARIVLNFTRDLLRNSPLLRSAIVAETADSLTVRQPATGALVEIRTVSCSSRPARGLAISTVIPDEVGHWLIEGEGPAVAGHVLRALGPSLAQLREHGRMILISTPWGRSGEFWTRFERAHAGSPGALAIQRATWEMVPEAVIPASFYEDERARDPDAFRGEFGAEFLASGGALIPFEEIQAAVADRLDLPMSTMNVNLTPARAPFPVLRAGRYVKDGREHEIGEADLDRAVENFAADAERGMPVAIDYDHSHARGRGSRAAGRDLSLFRRGVSCSPRSHGLKPPARAIAAGEYGHVSAEFSTDHRDETGAH